MYLDIWRMATIWELVTRVDAVHHWRLLGEIHKDYVWMK